MLKEDAKFSRLNELISVHYGKLGARGVANVLHGLGCVTNQIGRKGGQREARDTIGEHVEWKGRCHEPAEHRQHPQRVVNAGRHCRCDVAGGVGCCGKGGGAHCNVAGRVGCRGEGGGAHGTHDERAGCRQHPQRTEQAGRGGEGDVAGGMGCRGKGGGAHGTHDERANCRQHS